MLTEYLKSCPGRSLTNLIKLWYGFFFGSFLSKNLHIFFINNIFSISYPDPILYVSPIFPNLDKWIKYSIPHYFVTKTYSRINFVKIKSPQQESTGSTFLAGAGRGLWVLAGAGSNQNWPGPGFRSTPAPWGLLKICGNL